MIVDLKEWTIAHLRNDLQNRFQDKPPEMKKGIVVLNLEDGKYYEHDGIKWNEIKNPSILKLMGSWESA